MTNWTQAEAEAHEARVAARKMHPGDLNQFGEPIGSAFDNKVQPAHRRANHSDRQITEEEVAEAILTEIERRGWLCFRSNPAERTGRMKGEPDLQIWADRGRKFAFEVKRPVGGKLSTDQLGVIAWARKLGHAVHVVTSLAEFLNIVDAGI